MEEAKDDLTLKIALKERNLEELEEYKIQQHQLNHEIDSNTIKRDELSFKIMELQARIEELDQELDAITKEKSNFENGRRSESGFSEVSRRRRDSQCRVGEESAAVEGSRK